MTLNFVGNAHYKEKQEGKDNVAQFELIPWILSQCSNVNEARYPYWIIIYFYSINNRLYSY